jgi:polysaccharide export outer membrane protein
MSPIRTVLTTAALALAITVPALAQPASPAPRTAAPAAQPAGTPPGQVAPAGVTAPAGYTIGTDDILIVIFWQEKEMSGEVTVRPDGKISLPLLNEVEASGKTPEQLRQSIEVAARKFLQEPAVTIVVKQINSRKVFITGMVGKPGPYPLTAPTTVLQLIATAGGLQEYADREHIVIVRTENGRPASYRFNYKEVIQQKKLTQNIELKAGDTVVVP